MKKKAKASRSIKHVILKNISNPISVHGIYPYRGKISPKDVIFEHISIQSKNPDIFYAFH